MMRPVNKTTGKLALLAVAMFGFGYLLVPIYNVFCDITGLNGKTGEINIADVDPMAVDRHRTVTVEFDTNLRELPWEFVVEERKVSVHPGEIGEAVFRVRNNSDRDVIGRAIPSVAPTQASVYFDKTECFCFEEQLLRAGEEKEMVVRFVVNTELPLRFASLVLSYTFFEVPDNKTVNRNEAGFQIKNKS